jgi:phosphoserine aminotransferase
MLRTPNDRNLLNFSGGPGALADSVLQQVQASIDSVPGVGLSILGISHRSKWFIDLVRDTEERVRALLGLSNAYHVLFLQGGATQQFSTVAMAFNAGSAHPAEYLETGYWSGKSIEGATFKDMNEKPGLSSPASNIKVAWSGRDSHYTQLPRNQELKLSKDAPYFHYVSNETVEGLQFKEVMGLDSVARICDMSSDFLSAPVAADRYALIYAHAQKNLGPAGVTIVVIKDSMLERIKPGLPPFLDYRTHVQAHSNFNTPPVFAIYVVNLITRWLMQEVGGLAQMEVINQQKAKILYDAIDESQGIYLSSVNPHDRSPMNVTFKLPSQALEKEFLRRAESRGFSGLGGHRSVGGVRASLYNGVTLGATQRLAEFMSEFKTEFSSHF